MAAAHAGIHNLDQGPDPGPEGLCQGRGDTAQQLRKEDAPWRGGQAPGGALVQLWADQRGGRGWRRIAAGGKPFGERREREACRDIPLLARWVSAGTQHLTLSLSIYEETR